MRETTTSLILIHSLMRLALQEIVKLTDMRADSSALKQLVTDSHRTFVTVSQMMDKELGRETKDS